MEQLNLDAFELNLVAQIEACVITMTIIAGVIVLEVPLIQKNLVLKAKQALGRTSFRSNQWHVCFCDLR